MTHGQSFRLSPQQRQLLDSAEPAEHAARITECVFAIQGSVRTVRWWEAFEKVCSRYEILRTTIIYDPDSGLPGQAIAESFTADTADVSDTGDVTSYEVAADRLLAESRPQPGRAGLSALRARLLSNNERHLFYLSAPAACADLDTMLLLCERIRDMYLDAEDDPGQDPLQYADLSEWLNRISLQDRTDNETDYWVSIARRSSSSHLAWRGWDSPTRGTVARRSTRKVAFDADTNRALATAAVRCGATPAAVLAACWSVLVGQFAESDQLVIGLECSGRNHPDLIDAIGPLTSVVPLRIDLATRQDFGALIADTAARMREAHSEQFRFSWQQFATHLRNSGPEKVERFTSAFAYRSVPNALSEHRLRVSLVVSDDALDRYGLALSCLHQGGEHSARIHFDASRIAPEVVALLLERLLRMTSRAATLIDQPLSAIDVLPTTQSSRVIGFGTGAQSRASMAASTTLDQLFSDQASRTPERSAVVCGDRTSTYRELDLLSERLARRLMKRGVDIDTVVAVLLPPSIDLIATIIAIWKAGGAYLPLAPDLPTERIRYQLDNARAHLAVVDSASARSLPCHVTPLFVDDLSPDGTPSKQLRDSVTDRRAAYVIYTSGSTGTPKGVVVEHRAVISFWHAMRAATENSTPSHAPRQVALNAAISFDASVQQLVTLLGGDTLHLLTDAVRRDDQQIVRYVREHQIDVLNATPTHLDTMIRAGLLEPGRHHPAQILVAGELLPSRLWPPLADADASTAYNIYGPTECTVNATATPIEVGLPFDTIGKPLPGYQVILVDAHLRPVPVGVPGEIMISGEAVARGYVGAAGLTARRFVANRFGLPGQRAYLTGDLGRWRADGHLEFLGRRDDQIKLRGFRIELDEVTQTVRSHTSVRDAATVLQNGEHDARLVAYYVPEPGTTPTVDALRTHVRTRLPEFMTPAHFVGLTALPVNSSGKLDRRALPPVVYEKPGERYAPPVTAVQEAIATAWESALGIDRAGIDDSFFEMGGDSIRGIRVRARAAELGVDFAVQDLFEHQTIRALSAAVSEGTALTGDPTTSNLDHPRIQAPSDVIDYHPLTATQAAMLFQSEYRRAWAPFTNVRTMHLRGRVDINRVESAVAELIAAHPALRSAFELIAYDEPMQLVHATATPSLRVEDIRALPPENQTLLINEFVAAERAKNFDWRVPPLMRFAIHHRSDDSFQLTVTMHEVIVDGWSVATVLVDLFRRYVGDDVRSPTALFRDHVGRERRALADRTHQDFWSGYLDGCVPAALAGGVDSDEHHVLVVELSEELAGRLRALARAASVPLKSVLLAAHIWVVATAAGSSEAVTGVVTNGRPEIIDGDRVVGQFLNTLPMRCSARHKMSWHEYVRTTFATEQKIWRYRRYPAIQAFRQGNGRALFDTAFNFTHFHIYDAIDGFESIDDDFFERTDLALLADFSVDQRSAAINLVLNTTGLTRQQAEQIAGEYQSTLEMMATTPDDPVRRSRADYRDPAEFIDRTDNPEPSVSFVELFRAQAERTPDAVAVSARGEALSYAAVRDEADRIARTLIRRGLGPEAVVAVAAPRSTDILVALIGVLTAGAAYLPLDTETPQSHNARIVALCEPNFLLRTRDLGLPVDIPSADIATLRRSQQSGDNPAPRTHPTNIAYVIPTSGSGGMPKAVAVTHAAMINHLLAKKRELDLAPDDVVAFLAKPTFDISIWQMLAPLLAGSRVVIPTSNAPECLLPVLASSRATVAQVTPSQLHVALDSKPDLPTLRQLISTGEELSPALAARWVRRFPNIQLINGYGPTECADNVTHHRVRGHGDRPVPLGTPIDRIAIHVLDHMLQPVRVGNVGQLAIAGPALARGYFGSPSDTASAFVADPRRTGARMYLTGDLVQTSHDGSIVFIGRTDRELKVNGIRFHPGQVESVLHEHPDVNRAVVTTTRGPGRRRTVAHVVVDGHRTHSRDMARDIRAHVGKRLPIVFVPNHVVFVEKIPMNEHGKLDIASLPLPAAADHARTPPATESERALLRLWHQTVGDEPIGVTADMFQAGLDSVYAMRFVVAARERLGLHIDLDALFATPTLAELAARVSLTESTSAAAAHTDDLPQPGE